MARQGSEYLHSLALEPAKIATIHPPPWCKVVPLAAPSVAPPRGRLEAHGSADLPRDLGGNPPRHAPRRRGPAAAAAVEGRCTARSSLTRGQGGAGLPSGTAGRGLCRGTRRGPRMALSRG